MNSLPYFLALVKKNILIWTMITTGTFSNSDLKNVDHDFISDYNVILYNYPISQEDIFHLVSVKFTPEDTKVYFTTFNSKYLAYTKYYFGTDIFEKLKDVNIDQAVKVEGMYNNIPEIEMAPGVPVKVMIGYDDGIYRIELSFPKAKNIRQVHPPN